MLAMCNKYIMDFAMLYLKDLLSGCQGVMIVRSPTMDGYIIATAIRY
ncbi:hypothetical protein H6H03_37835 [Nostoc paludosum FACHB-159]|uniref:Uncharacterized protein n=1 Tax=Nostoc paludosum FACHB-159 TaxID=2692908 RepID=A0ABR8KNX5_9NOSO|nr:hypothetical protein [Nostoc sp. FACHB-857]MBD2739553.1 hypothetical protein [Nostoc paludosum FACHB-159]